MKVYVIIHSDMECGHIVGSTVYASKDDAVLDCYAVAEQFSKEKAELDAECEIDGWPPSQSPPILRECADGYSVGLSDFFTVRELTLKSPVSDRHTIEIFREGDGRWIAEMGDCHAYGVTQEEAVANVQKTHRISRKLSAGPSER